MKIGCSLIGYNYEILKSSSEASYMAVKKFTSAILLVSFIWGGIGYCFTERYLQLGVLGSSVGSLVMIVIIIQVEKQIILGIGKSNWAVIFRGGIAVIMALLGSLIIDQIIFKQDIEIAMTSKLNKRVNVRLSEKLSEINNEIYRLDTLISDKNIERSLIIEEITKNPVIKMPGFKYTTIPYKFTRETVDPESGEMKVLEIDSVRVHRDYSSTSKENPKVKFITQIDNEINVYSLDRTTYLNKKLVVREIVENEEKNKIGFLDEIDTMKDIVTKNWVSMAVWSLLFSFFILIELFVVTSKIGRNNKTDYDVAILHQRDVRIAAINELTKGGKNKELII